MAKKHTVDRGENLSVIAQQYPGVTVDDIVEANNIQNKHLIYPNATLTIPEKRTGPGTALETLPNVEKTGEREKVDLDKETGPGTALETLPNVEKTGEREKVDVGSEENVFERAPYGQEEEDKPGIKRKPRLELESESGKPEITPKESNYEKKEKKQPGGQNVFEESPYEQKTGYWRDPETGKEYSGERQDPSHVRIGGPGEESEGTESPEGPEVTPMESDYEKKEKIETDGEGNGGGEGEGDEGDESEGGETGFAISEWLPNNKYYKALDEQTQNLVKYFAQTLDEQNEEKAKALAQSLKLAKEQADPYWAEKISIAEDSLERAITGAEKDLQYTEDTLSRRKSRLKEDLEYKKDQISTEKAAELSRRERRYEKQLEDTRKKMANRGLSFSSIQNEAVEYAEEEYEDIVESTKRQYDRELRQARKKKERGFEDVEAELEKERRQTEETITGKVRTAEAKLGTEELSDVAGIEGRTLGDISGTFQEKKAGDILQRSQGLMLQNYGG